MRTHRAVVNHKATIRLPHAIGNADRNLKLVSWG